ncbi:MAG: type II secretion system ATPase GspE [Deltaproteobacteria bacterium]|nr:type II secretion system ATPase GspE [Deltaproteobacteria bacterium]MBI2210806.1 type II secretion system ATPase GspE [Deltaproteobacteria bacterium]MBI2347025.1 type II secretion system ATPase GspE [Deltaproteobacteria bacterium]
MEKLPRLEERLVERGLVSAQEMERILKLQQEQQAPLARLVVELGFVSEDDLLPVLSDHLGIPLVSLKDFPLGPLPVEALLDAVEFLKFAKMAPVKAEGAELLVATPDPTGLSRLHALELATGLKVKPVLAKEKEVTARIETLFGNGEAVTGLAAARDREGGVDEEEVEHLRDLASEVPVIRLVNQMLGRALEGRASDIHIEPFENQLKVRYRIDGILHEIDPPPRHLKAAIISRLKILAQLNIAERRLPQDGRIKVKIAGKDVDLRISTVPTLYGESVVIRLLERAQIFTDLESLGFPPAVLQRFSEMISKPHGMILVTGPTGSGKTTTLYGALQKINDPGKKIITIEDPVEYELGGVNQIQVKPQIGLTFANGLRSIVRQDPDIIMVGEIRDFETAEIAVQAALTGHLVLSTLHTNDAAGAISRLLEMGVQDYLLASSLLGVLAQRLVRRLCQACRKEAPFNEFSFPISDFTRQNEKPPATLWQAAGCEACSGTGYLGRVGIFELLPASAEICKLIVQRADANAIRSLASAQGMRLLREDGWQKACQGGTDVAEVLRVTREEG